MTKGPDAFRTISEVSEQLNIPQHVLRFWETRFSQIRPLKRSGGRRFYRPDDIVLLAGIRHLLYGSGYTIRGVQRILKERGVAHVQQIGLRAGDGMLSEDMSALLVEQDQGLEFSPQADTLSDDGSYTLHENADDAFEGTHGAADDSPPVAEPPSTSEWQDDAFAREAAPADANDASDSSGWDDAKWSDETAPQAADTSFADPVINRYAPGPLSGRAERAGTPRAEAGENRIIRPQYRLTTDTREQLKTALEELRECRRLLHGALSHQND